MVRTILASILIIGSAAAAWGGVAEAAPAYPSARDAEPYEFPADPRDLGVSEPPYRPYAPSATDADDYAPRDNGLREAAPDAYVSAEPPYYEAPPPPAEDGDRAYASGWGGRYGVSRSRTQSYGGSYSSSSRVTDGGAYAYGYQDGDRYGPAIRRYEDGSDSYSSSYEESVARWGRGAEGRGYARGYGRAYGDLRDEDELRLGSDFFYGYGGVGGAVDYGGYYSSGGRIFIGGGASAGSSAFASARASAFARGGGRGHGGGCGCH